MSEARATDGADDMGRAEAFDKWWAKLAPTVGGRVVPGEAFARHAWAAGADWATGAAAVGHSEKGMVIVAAVTAVAFNAKEGKGLYTAQTIVATDVNEEGRITVDMPDLLIKGCGEALRKLLLEKMGYVEFMGRVIWPEDRGVGPERKVM